MTRGRWEARRQGYGPRVACAMIADAHAPPSTVARLAQTVSVVALGVWTGALAMAGLCAGLTFATSKDMQPTLPSFANFPDEHWRIAGGQIAQRIFVASDIVQLACAAIAVAALGAISLWGRSWFTPRRMVVRVITLALPMCVLSYQLLVLAPRMDTNLRNYWASAQAGEVDKARAFRAAFEEDHPTASKVLSATCALALVAFIAAAWPVIGSGAGPRRREGVAA